jgi:uncharacterized SAM-binding protein YcdF (DUF218 family)
MGEKKAIEILWDYLSLPTEFVQTDMLLVLGSYDTNVPVWAAGVYAKNRAPRVVFSGSGTIHAGTAEWKHMGGRPEADMFAEIAMAHGIPQEVILIENQSQNTGENFLFTKRLLNEKGISIESGCIVTKPYMARRALATAKKQCPKVDWHSASEHVSYTEYVQRSPISETHMLNIMLGDFVRIIEYPKRGFQIEQEIPQEVHNAYAFLVAVGYSGKQI